MVNNINVRNLLILVVFVTTSFMYALSANHVEKIKMENPNIFAERIKASTVTFECPNGLTVDQECDEKVSFSSKFQSIIKQRESLIGVWNDISTVCFYLSVIIAIVLAYSLWSGRKVNK
ncbi:hypothetical protein WKH56_20300 [Priestia sp. SB1]|uniref:hypothetical protein n=1 Tax=Priestia sp. SB1 TaxID=3132359 RepID=UPI0031791DE3